MNNISMDQFLSSRRAKSSKKNSGTKRSRVRWRETAATLCYEADKVIRTAQADYIVVKGDKKAFKKAVAELREIVEKMEEL